jgi:hypothetical protein
MRICSTQRKANPAWLAFLSCRAGAQQMSGLGLEAEWSSRMNKNDGTPYDLQRDTICTSAAHHVAALALLMVAEEQDPALPLLQVQARQAYQELVALLRDAGYLASSSPEFAAALRPEQS